MLDALTGIIDTRLQLDLLRVSAEKTMPPCDALVVCSMPGEDLRDAVCTVSSLAAGAARACPETVVIVAARRGLQLSLRAARASALEPLRILSTGALPAIRRESLRLARNHDVCVSQVQVPALGGDSPADQVILERYASVSGIPVSMLDGPSQRATAGPKPEYSSDQLVRAAALLVEAVMLDRRAVLCCGAWIEGSYGLPPCFAVAPVRVGAQGGESPLPLSLTLEEKALLMRSASFA